MTTTATKKYCFQDVRSKKVWNFVWLNLVSIGAMLVLFFAILYGDATTGAFAAVWNWFSNHQVVMALAASTPLFAALLVGRASSAKAKRRRLADAKHQAAAEAARARAERQARRSRAR